MIGNNEIKSQIKVAIASAKRRNTAPPHMLLTGNAGCGKTTTAKEIAKSIGGKFISVIPEELKDKQKLLAIFKQLTYKGYDDFGNRVDKIEPAVVFIDEIHRMPMYGQEKLGIAMENYTIEADKPGYTYWLPRFTVIGATTLAGNLSKPFRDRFKLTLFFTPYGDDDACEIVKLHAARLGIYITNKAIKSIVKRGRGVPRVLIRYLENCRDMALAKQADVITSKLVEETFKLLGINEDGLVANEIKLLQTLYKTDTPIGLETLSMILGEPQKTIKDSIEPYLVKKLWMVRSGKGRTITKEGAAYLENRGLVDGGGVGRLKLLPKDNNHWPQ